MLDELLASPTVSEVCELRSRFGFMAFHGGELEKVTDVVAAEAAEAAGASYYGIIQTEDPLTHIPSKYVDPAHSPALAKFIDHVDVVVTMHGYGRQHLRRSLLFGGRNRELARHVARHLRRTLPDYDMVVELEELPTELSGQHPDNPVNRPRLAGVQIELPPLVRWHLDGWHWSDRGESGRAEQVQRLIQGLATAATDWPLGESSASV